MPPLPAPFSKAKAGDEVILRDIAEAARGLAEAMLGEPKRLSAKDGEETDDANPRSFAIFGVDLGAPRYEIVRAGCFLPASAGRA